MSNTLVDPKLAPLFKPVTLGALRLPNRILMAPMTRSRANGENAVHGLQVDYYRQRASAGLIVSEGTQVSPEGIGYIATPGIHSEAQVAGWREVTTAVHAAGGRILAQLWHVGRISHSDLLDGKAPVAPSAIAAEGTTYTPTGPKPFSEPRALETSEIARVVADFAHGAKCALEAGFDGVQIHGANGYLIDQFLRDSSNKRTDRYGGDAEARSRFLVEVTEAVVDVWGGDKVSVRLSPANAGFNSMQDSDPATTFAVAAKAISGLGLAYLEGVVGDPSQRSLHDLLRESFGGNYVANGGFDAATGAEWLATGRAAAISYGSSFISNPDLPERFRVGAAFNTPNRETFYGGGAEGYVDYPSL